MTAIRILVLVAVLLSLAAIAGVARPEGARSAAASESSQLTVVGGASVTAVPDRATFSFGVETRAQTASAALAQNAAATRRVIAAVAAAGVDRKDLQTQLVSLSPLTDDEGRTIVGYVAQNQVAATLDDLPRAGSVVDAAVGAGANQISGPSLVSSDRDDLYRDALKGAYADARSKAQALASASGRALGRIVTVTESGAAPPVVLGTARATADAVPIEPGTQEISATVTVTFALA